ncbi:hypothetical protein HY256_06070 [Candidatus Sumerlaeota bacterium]|nr:hypothetical protein [Candidatus Sumerlaeota bacterium]
MKRSTGLRPALIPFGLILLAVVAACASGRGNGKRSEPLRAMMESAIEKVKPALVRIHVVETDYE